MQNEYDYTDVCKSDDKRYSVNYVYIIKILKYSKTYNLFIYSNGLIWQMAYV